MHRHKIFAVIPAYNAAKTIAQVVTELQQHVPNVSVIVVNDGSVDSTAEITKKLDVISINLKKNLGKGAALRYGLREALALTAEFIFTIDSDGQHNPIDCTKFLKEILNKELDMVIGTRMANLERMPFYRQISNKMTSKLISWRIKKKIEDSQSGFRLYRAQLIQSLKLSSVKFEIESEMLIKAALMGYKIGAVNIKTIYPNNQISYIKIIDIFRFLKLYLRSFRW